MSSDRQTTTMAIVVGGGPAPGINGVIAAATIRARLDGTRVIGIRDGFSQLMLGKTDHVMPLDIETVSRVHFRGGSILGTSRANPTKDPAHLENVVKSLLALGVSQLVTIGGDDTAFSAMSVERQAAGRIRVVHVPKTIDNDLDLPPEVETFGFQTAREHGTKIVESLMVDAKTTGRWYFVVAMGRTAGHLALGIGKAAGATVTLITEEFTPPIPMNRLVDILAGAIIKRESEGRSDGVAILSEGISLKIDPADFEKFGDVERDAHGHIRLAEVNLGDVLKTQVSQRLKGLGLKTTIASKNIGYELRCVDPIPFDMEYTRDLGYCAAEFLATGGSAVMVSMQNSRFVPVPFSKMIDPATGKTRVRLTDTSSAQYAIARRFMIRLRRSDFDRPETLAKLAATVKLTPAEFSHQFRHLVEHDGPEAIVAHA